MSIERNYLFSWVRKGIAAKIAEVDELGVKEKIANKIIERPFVQLKMQLAATPVDTKDKNSLIQTTEEKNFSIVGPGDILSISSNAVMNMYPPAGNEGLPISYWPYIEFWEPDFAWRYTPAAVNADRIRPWLAVVTCETSCCKIMKNSNGLDIVTFNVKDEAEYKSIFPSPTSVWTSAHAQGETKENADFCRIVGIKRDGIQFKPETEYSAFVIPVFEVARLRALGYDDDVKATVAQMSAWEDSFSEQKNRKDAFSFPSFFTWNFKTGVESFEKLTNKLQGYATEKSGISIDVSELGEGLSYSVLQNKPSKKSISMPAAMRPVLSKEEKCFPDPTEEAELYNNLRELLSRSPVFEENEDLISGKNNSSSSHGDDENTDPWVVPPIYGGKHIMATSLDNVGNQKAPAWFPKVNLDLHYRAAAGLGKKIVQEHQEQFVNRAWKQIEIVKALNNELYHKLLSVDVNNSMKSRTFNGMFGKKITKGTSRNGEISDKAFIKNLMLNLESMRNTECEGNDVSIASILENRNISSSFASTTFKHKTQQLSSIFSDIDLSSLVENIADGNVFKMKKLAELGYTKIDDTRFILVLANQIVKRHPSLAKDSPNWKITDLFDIERGSSNQENKFYLFSRKNDMLYQAPVITHAADPWIYVPESRWEVYYSYLSQKIRNDGPETYSKYFNWLKELTVSPIAQIPSHGKVFKSESEFTKDNSIGNILAIPSNIYQEIFGSEKIITEICDKSGKTYIVNRDEFLKQRQNSQKLKSNTNLGFAIPAKNINSSTWEMRYCDFDSTNQDSMLTVGSCTIASNKKNTLIESITNEATKNIQTVADYKKYRKSCTNTLEEALKSCSDKKISGYSSTLTYKKFLGYALFKDSQYDSYNYISIKIKVTSKDGSTQEFNREWVIIHPWQLTMTQMLIDYGIMAVSVLFDAVRPFLLNVPDSINIKSEALSNAEFRAAYVQDISSVYDWAMKIVKKDEKKELSQISDSTIRAYWEYHRILESVKTNVASQDDIAKTNDNQEIKDLIQLQQQLNEDKTLNESQEKVQNNYFSEFCANTEEAKKIRDRYVNDLLHSKYPIMAYPQFPEPTYYYLKQLADKFILPCVNELPDNTVSIFNSNESFVEAYLCGMNTEMGRELLWREYPTDQRGSYFKKFWDTDTKIEDIRNDSFFDIKSIHRWENDLGENHNDAKSCLLMFAVKGKLMKNYPDTEIYLHKAKFNGVQDNTLNFGIDESATEDNGGIIMPAAQAFFRDDIYVVGFKISFEKALGNPNDSSNQGYMLVFKQRLENTNFTSENGANFQSLDQFASKSIVKPYVCGKHVLTFIR